MLLISECLSSKIPRAVLQNKVQTLFETMTNDMSFFNYIIREHPKIVALRTKDNCTFAHYLFQNKNFDCMLLLHDMVPETLLDETYNRRTTLHVSILNGCYEIVDMILQTSKKKNFLARLLTTKSPVIHYAAQFGSFQIFELILNFKYNSLDFKDAVGRNVLHCSVISELDALQKVELLLSRKDATKLLYMQSSFAGTPIDMALSKNAQAAMLFLLARHCVPLFHQRHPFRMPLFEAARSVEPLIFTKLLAIVGVEALDTFGWDNKCVLHWTNHCDIATEILRHRPLFISHKDKSKNNILHYSDVCRNEALVPFFCAKCPYLLFEKNSFGKTPIESFWHRQEPDFTIALCKAELNYFIGTHLISVISDLILTYFSQVDFQSNMQNDTRNTQHSQRQKKRKTLY